MHCEVDHSILLWRGDPPLRPRRRQRIVGVKTAHLPTAAAKRLPKHPLPVALLRRLAVDQLVQDIGLGEALLIDVLQRSLDLSKSLGVFAVEVVAIDDRAAAFYAKHGFMPLLDNPRHMYLPMATIEGVVTRSPVS